MTSNRELQEEELEVLQSIYEGDDKFKEISPTVFQYKFGEEVEGACKSFLVEISWGEDYPEQLPTISMDTFYNKLIVPEVKELVVRTLKEQGEPWLGTAMTYTLFEHAKENVEVFLANQPLHPVQSTIFDEMQEKSKGSSADTESAKVKEKKEHLTKAQKRKLVNRQDNKGEMPRGWDWVDVVKHLSQTGRSETVMPATET